MIFAWLRADSRVPEIPEEERLVDRHPGVADVDKDAAEAHRLSRVVPLEHERREAVLPHVHQGSRPLRWSSTGCQLGRSADAWAARCRRRSHKEADAFAGLLTPYCWNEYSALLLLSRRSARSAPVERSSAMSTSLRRRAAARRSSSDASSGGGATGPAAGVPTPGTSRSQLEGGGGVAPITFCRPSPKTYSLLTRCEAHSTRMPSVDALATPGPFPRLDSFLACGPADGLRSSPPCPATHEDKATQTTNARQRPSFDDAVGVPRYTK